MTYSRGGDLPGPVADKLADTAVIHYEVDRRTLLFGVTATGN